MQFGCDLQLKNARTHTALDLATDPEVRALIQLGINSKNCASSKCGHSRFDFRNVQYYCENSNKFYASTCCTRDWVFESKDSGVKERPVCRSDKVLENIMKAENDLKEAMETNDFKILDDVRERIIAANTDIDVKLKHEADVLHLKLEKELDIKNFISEVLHVGNYKTIRKSVTVLNKKLADAKVLGVEVDPSLEKEVNEHSARLISERNLRFEMENMYVSGSTKETVEKLQELINVADESKVEGAYLNNANDLARKMNDNILARDTYEMMHAYPVREYTDPEPVDPKTGKPIKVKEDKKKKPKRKKKEPQLQYPDWATTIEDV